MENPLDRVACVIPASTGLEKVLALALDNSCRIVELRLDLLKLSIRESTGLVGELASRGVKTIVTLRSREEGGRYNGSPDVKLDMLLSLLDHGAWMADFEYWFPLLDEALRQAGSKIIVSVHEYRWTPQPEILYSYVGDIIRRGAGIAKIVVMARRIEDNWRLIGLNAWRPGRVVAFAMGNRGRLSRVLAPLAGAPFTYVSLGEPAAPGQLSLRELLSVWRALGVIGEKSSDSIYS